MFTLPPLPNPGGDLRICAKSLVSVDYTLNRGSELNLFQIFVVFLEYLYTIIRDGYSNYVNMGLVTPPPFPTPLNPKRTHPQETPPKRDHKSWVMMIFFLITPLCNSKRRGGEGWD